MFSIHLSHISDSNFYFKNYKSKQNLSKLLINTKKKILNIEIYDLHRQLYKNISEIIISGRKLSEFLLVYIWNDKYFILVTKKKIVVKSRIRTQHSSRSPCLCSTRLLIEIQ